MYYGEGQLHVVQHLSGWNLVTKGTEAYEWKFGSKSGQIAVADPKELVEYTAYLTDPAQFATYLNRLSLTKPELFEDPRPGVPGCKEFRLKERHELFRAIHVNEKLHWYGAIEFEDEKNDERSKLIFANPKAIEKIPDKVFERVKGIKFRKSKHTLRRHMTYL